MCALLGGTAFAASLTVTSSNFTSYRSCVLTAYPATSGAAIDSYVDQLTPNANNGTNASLHSSSLASGNRRTYIKFDITECSPAIGVTVTVTNATLRLFITGLPALCRTEDIFRVTSSWTESGIKWNNQPFGTSTNNPPSNQRTDSVNVGTASCANTTNNVYLSWNVLADVSAYVAGTATNYGWMVRDDAESNAVAQLASFSAKNSGTLSQSPQLIVTYR